MSLLPGGIFVEPESPAERVADLNREVDKKLSQKKFQLQQRLLDFKNAGRPLAWWAPLSFYVLDPGMGQKNSAKIEKFPYVYDEENGTMTPGFFKEIMYKNRKVFVLQNESGQLLSPYYYNKESNPKVPGLPYVKTGRLNVKRDGSSQASTGDIAPKWVGRAASSREDDLNEIINVVPYKSAKSNLSTFAKKKARALGLTPVKQTDDGWIMKDKTGKVDTEQKYRFTDKKWEKITSKTSTIPPPTSKETTPAQPQPTSKETSPAQPPPTSKETTPGEDNTPMTDPRLPPNPSDEQIEAAMKQFNADPIYMSEGKYSMLGPYDSRLPGEFVWKDGKWANINLPPAVDSSKALVDPSKPVVPSKAVDPSKAVSTDLAQKQDGEEKDEEGTDINIDALVKADEEKPLKPRKIQVDERLVSLDFAAGGEFTDPLDKFIADNMHPIRPELELPAFIQSSSEIWLAMSRIGFDNKDEMLEFPKVSLINEYVSILLRETNEELSVNNSYYVDAGVETMAKVIYFDRPEFYDSIFARSLLRSPAKKEVERKKFSEGEMQGLLETIKPIPLKDKSRGTIQDLFNFITTQNPSQGGFIKLLSQFEKNELVRFIRTNKEFRFKSGPPTSEEREKLMRTLNQALTENGRSFISDLVQQMANLALGNIIPTVGAVSLPEIASAVGNMLSDGAEPFSNITVNDDDDSEEKSEEKSNIALPSPNLTQEQGELLKSLEPSTLEKIAESISEVVGTDITKIPEKISEINKVLEKNVENLMSTGVIPGAVIAYWLIKEITDAPLGTLIAGLGFTGVKAAEKILMLARSAGGILKSGGKKAIDFAKGMTTVAGVDAALRIAEDPVGSARRLIGSDKKSIFWLNLLQMAAIYGPYFYKKLTEEPETGKDSVLPPGFHPKFRPDIKDVPVSMIERDDEDEILNEEIYNNFGYVEENGYLGKNQLHEINKLQEQVRFAQPLATIRRWEPNHGVRPVPDRWQESQTKTELASYFKTLRRKRKNRKMWKRGTTKKTVLNCDTNFVPSGKNLPVEKPTVTKSIVDTQFSPFRAFDPASSELSRTVGMKRTSGNTWNCPWMKEKRMKKPRVPMYQKEIFSTYFMNY